jgi:2-hydroxy-6-oxonona-2,4-dienedioate hydrolase
VVLVHGLVVSSRYMVPTAERLTSHCRVFAPDLPGFGRNEKPPRALDVAGLSDALSAWMGELGLERAALVGNSFGTLAEQPEWLTRKKKHREHHLPKKLAFPVQP